MSYIVDSLDNWKDESGEIISKALFNTDVFSLANVVPGIKHTKTINIADYSINAVDAACGWSPSGNTTYTQANLVVDSKQVKEAYCPRDLEDKYLSQYLRRGVAGNEELPFAEIIATGKAEQIAKYVSNKLFTATTGAGDAFDGFATLISSSTAGVNSVSSATSGWTADNALDEVDKFITALPAEAQVREDLVMFMSPTNFNTYKAALRKANLFVLNTGDMNNNRVLNHPHSSLTIVMSDALSNDQVTIGPAEYHIVGTDLLDDMDNIDIFYSRDNDEVRLKSGFKYGAQIVFPELFASNV